MLLGWDKILTFMIPARRLLTAKHAQDVTFASQLEGEYGHLQVLNNLHMSCTDSRLLYKSKPQPQLESLTSHEHSSCSCSSARCHWKLCEELVGKILKSPSNALASLKLSLPLSACSLVLGADLKSDWTSHLSSVASQGTCSLTSQLTACFVSLWDLTMFRQLKISLWLILKFHPKI